MALPPELPNIGYFPRLGISGTDISDLVRLERVPATVDSSLGIGLPTTRNHIYRGQIQGRGIFVKPYESPLERAVVLNVFGIPFSLLLDYNSRYFIEGMANGQPAEVVYRNGQIDAVRLGQIVGTFLRELHKLGVGYGHTLEQHLLMNKDGPLKAIDFGSSKFQLGGFIEDIVTALEYLRDVTLYRGLDEIKRAIDAFRGSYSRNRYFEDIFVKGLRRHLKFADENDSLRIILR